MFTYKIISNVKDKEAAVADVVVEFTDGTSTFQKEFKISTPSVLKELIDNEISAHQTIDAFVSLIPAGTTDLSALQKIVSPLEQARTDFDLVTMELRRLDEFLRLGIFDNTEPVYVAALQLAQQKWDVYRKLLP